MSNSGMMSTPNEQVKQLPTLYQLALEELETKFKVIRSEWKHRNGYSPIEHIKTRLKEPKSIISKCERKGLPVNLDSIVNKIYDIAGMRIVCAFVKDIYSILEHLKSREDLRIVEIKDYIDKPKPNGYQSLHVIVQVPLVLFEDIRWIYVEIQMRTLAMDFWASMEHIIFYKYEEQVPPHVVNELTDAAKAVDMLDRKMLELRKEILNYNHQDWMDRDIFTMNMEPAATNE
ncbi:MAG: GTP pyrophosphokinase family protein [Paenibacillus sp.]|uniref:Putative GTP pyrophosphokinase n=1 Tax=Paenibacillus aquistagni TaxID=1852522 RepID=A0A1X7L9L9_9BACL|nr:GTP pyrophosphokinase family protein [Paenibacillus aquistagni]MBR2568097.1 GTP pyrophosphokinase family protein [Paenibacillus sp.]NMM53149.1 GTP pyrophosphokinase family protein [Paenibacillus aquistagni]SMG50546.1 putative GTP pyrophosphokinase [Paenibacillus aquistagni]